MKTFKHLLANQRGIVLVISLMVLALLLGAGVGAIVSVQTDLRSTSNFARGTQAFYIAEAGINHARHELQDGDGTKDFDQVFGASPWTVDPIVPSTSFNGGTYIVTFVESAGTDASPPKRIKLLSVGTLPNNTSSQIEAWFRKDAGRPRKAIETNDNLEIDGNPKILGTCGGAHTNKKMDVDGNPAVQMVNGLRSSDEINIDGDAEPCLGSAACAGSLRPEEFVLNTSSERNAYEEANDNAPTYPVPQIDAKDYAPKVAAMRSAGNHYILHNDGTVTTGGTCGTDGLCGGGDPVFPVPTGWSLSGGKWKVSGTTAANGVFYSETTVEISGSPGTAVSPWQATIISRHDIEVLGSPRIKPYPTTSEDLKNHLFVTGEHLKIDEDSNMKADYASGAILVRGKVEIKGNPTIHGFIIAGGKGKFEGNMQITYTCDTGCSGPGCPLPTITMGSFTEKF